MIDIITQTTIKNSIAQIPELANAKIFIFGSRAQNTNSPYSDIDLGIDAGIPLSGATIVQLDDQLEQSDLPFTVDIVDFQQVTAEFKQIALQHTIPLQ